MGGGNSFSVLCRGGHRSQDASLLSRGPGVEGRGLSPPGMLLSPHQHGGCGCAHFAEKSIEFWECTPHGPSRTLQSGWGLTGIHTPTGIILHPRPGPRAQGPPEPPTGLRGHLHLRQDLGCDRTRQVPGPQPEFSSASPLGPSP